jgi:hypothetical protein
MDAAIEVAAFLLRLPSGGNSKSLQFGATGHKTLGIAASRLKAIMIIHIRNMPVSFLIRRSVRYLLVSHGFRLIQAIVVLAALNFVLTGSRIIKIDQFGNRADIVAAIFVTIATIALLSALNQRGMTAIDRRFFREAYNSQLILTDLVIDLWLMSSLR